MDPVTIATGLVALLAPLMSAAGTAAAGEIGRNLGAKTADRLSDVWRRLQPRLGDDRAAALAAARLAENPDDARARRELAAGIAQILAADRRLARDAERTVRPVIRVHGDHNVVQYGRTVINAGQTGDITITG